MSDLICPYCSSHKCKVDYDLTWKDDRFPKYQVASCADCKVGFVLPLPTQEELDHLYNSLQYHSEDRSTVNFAEADESVLAKRIEDDGKIIQKYEPHVPSSGSVLDIGAGWGTLLKYFDNQGFATTGLELSKPTSTFAREQLGLDIHNLPVERINELLDQKFDLITMRHVLEHFYYPRDVLTSVRERMTQDAKLIIEVPDYGSYDRKKFGTDWPAFGPYHLWYFTRENLSRLMADTGFEILHFHTFMSETVFSGSSPFSRIARKIANRLGGRYLFSGRSIGFIAKKK